MDARYFVDTNALIHLNRRYPHDVFPGLWKKIEGLICEERIMAPTEVSDEIGRGDDELVPWSRDHQEMFQSADTSLVQEILKDHPSLVKADAKHESADPYIIALAMSYKSDASGLVPIIVTHEKVDSPTRIPHVAQAKGIQSCKLLEMFRREKWRL